MKFLDIAKNILLSLSIGIIIPICIFLTIQTFFSITPKDFAFLISLTQKNAILFWAYITAAASAFLVNYKSSNSVVSTGCIIAGLICIPMAFIRGDVIDIVKWITSISLAGIILFTAMKKNHTS